MSNVKVNTRLLSSSKTSRDVNKSYCKQKIKKQGGFASFSGSEKCFDEILFAMILEEKKFVCAEMGENKN